LNPAQTDALAHHHVNRMRHSGTLSRRSRTDEEQMLHRGGIRAEYAAKKYITANACASTRFM
ncbi:MAG: hypothetical protein J2P53_02055, partial [Bradyrhizobiaceae bacterium]|nr:hypothetical protein [Bradyrhizobiaceae bacterium]